MKGLVVDFEVSGLDQALDDLPEPAGRERLEERIVTRSSGWRSLGPAQKMDQLGAGDAGGARVPGVGTGQVERGLENNPNQGFLESRGG